MIFRAGAAIVIGQMYRVGQIVLLAALTACAASGQTPPAAKAPTPQPLGPAGQISTNRPTGQLGLSTRRLATSSAHEATVRELFRGAVRLMPDDRVEFSYDFTAPDQLEDFAPEPGSEARTFLSGPWEVRDGFLQKSFTNDVAVFHRALFVGPVDVTFKGFLVKGANYAAGFFDTVKNGQLIAGVGGQPLTMFLTENGKTVAEALQSPLAGKAQDLCVKFDGADFSIGPVGGRPLAARRSVGDTGQVCWVAPDSIVALDDVRITGALDLEWFRRTMDARMTKDFQGRVTARYGPPPCTESQLRQMIRGFKRLLPDGKAEMHYDFSDVAQFADWQVTDAKGRADAFAWRVYDGVVSKSQFGPTWLGFQPPLVGPMKVSARASIVSGTEACIGLRDMEADVTAGFRLGAMGWHVGDAGGKRAQGQCANILLRQLHLLEIERDETNIVARLDGRETLKCQTTRKEPFNAVLAATDSTAAFDDVHVVAFLDYDWCLRQLKLHGFKQATLPGGLKPSEKKPTEPGKLAQSVSFSSVSRIKVMSNADWQDTRIMLRRGDKVSINTSGSYQYGKASGQTSSADGLQGETMKNRPPCPKLTPCALVGRVGFGDPFEIGASNEFVAKELGALSLRVNEQPVYDNSGALDAEILVIPVAK